MTSISLAGTSWVSIPSANRGAYRVHVKSSREGGPTLIFQLTKASSNAIYNPGNSTVSPGLDGTRLGYDWPPNSPIKVSKNTNSYDGGYQITVYS
jgi:hypothetical protein